MKPIKVGNIVYHKKLGWSGVPMEVLERDSNTALCKGAKGWNVNGLYSTKYGVYVKRFAINNLTHEPNSMVRISRNGEPGNNEPEETYWTHPSLTNGERNPGL